MRSCRKSSLTAGACGTARPHDRHHGLRHGSQKYAEIVARRAEIKHRYGGSGSVQAATETIVHTSRGLRAGYVINCAGLHSDRVSRMAGQAPEVLIVPFRGEYYDLVPERTIWSAISFIPYRIPDFLFSEFISPAAFTAESMPAPTQFLPSSGKVISAQISI